MARIQRSRSSYHSSGRSGWCPPWSSTWVPPEGKGFLDFLRHFSADNVAAVLIWRAEKGAEAAGAHAHVGIVDVAVAHVGDNGFRVQAQTHGVGQLSKRVQVGLVVQGWRRRGQGADHWRRGLRPGARLQILRPLRQRGLCAGKNVLTGAPPWICRSVY